MELLDEAAVRAALQSLDWEQSENELLKIVRYHDFRAALGYVNEVGRLAEAVGHHPDIDLRWNVVILHLSTHSLGGISDADVALAHSIDSLS